MPIAIAHPDWPALAPWRALARRAGTAAVRAALRADWPGIAEFAALLSPAADTALEALAARARQLTRRHFGRTIALYVPLYLSDYCCNRCLYCGFAADRRRPRRRLTPRQIAAEFDTLAAMGFEEILLLTGDRTPHAGYAYVREAVRMAARKFHLVTVEVFPMTTAEYRGLARAGCTGLTIYQETYDPAVYARMHPAGPKRDYRYRLETPARALLAGLRTAGLGVLLGLADPLDDALALFQHVRALRAGCWRAGVSVSFPRVRPQLGGFAPRFPVDDRLLTRLICAFRICLPDVPLVLSTREPARLRDSLAGIGISKMSIASRTTVGGYHADLADARGQFEVSDGRSVAAFRAALRRRGLDPVFKTWDAVYRDAAGDPPGGAPRPLPRRP